MVNSSGKQDKWFNKDLSAVKSIQITDGNRVISTLVNRKNDFSVKNAKSLISFSNGYDFLEYFFRVPIPLKKGMKIYIQSVNGDRFELGSIEALDAYKKLFVFMENYIKSQPPHYYDDYSHLFFFLEEMPPFVKQRIGKMNRSFKLFIENYKLGTLMPYNLNGKNVLKLVFDKYKKSIFVTGPSHGHVREKDFPDDFFLYIQYNMESGKSFKSLIPDWKCKKEKQKMHLNLSNFIPIAFKNSGF